MTETTETNDQARSQPLLADQSADAGSCGCGGCGCGAADTGSATTSAASKAIDVENTMTTHSYAVSGMTCGHCAGAVTSELKSLAGVTDVQIELVAGGISTVTVVSVTTLDDTHVTGALEEAGDYQLAQR
ncbi:heavy-metal-associated domain-containing protein [Nocardioides piscis]|jgi:copper chaperone|uniref:heavy-metal-associated domain-containing protein n=1 Tax=Nocardioides piscis TaxID=2714938 RepID=UPI00248349EE|nr:heavy-metal-associated domain-containing protein [Nocardioides piscis]